MDLVIEAKSLVKRYGEVIAVDQVSFSVRRGSLFGLLGPNGSGKTTMIRMLTGQIQPTSGTATVLGLDLKDHPVKIRELVGIIPEQETPPSFLTPTEYLNLVGDVRKIPDILQRVEEWFEFLEYADKKNVLCKDLSRGTRQKLMFTQAFIHKPSLALIDEPLINFDPIMQRKVKDFLVSYVNQGNTIFISTHLLDIAEEICSDFAILHKGALLYSGPVSELAERKMRLDDFFLSLVRKENDA